MTGRLVVAGWSPEPSGAGAGEEHLPTAPGDVDVTVERPESDWAPMTVATTPPVPIRFVDGVRRIETALSHIPDGDESPRDGLAVSLAAGSVRCEGSRAEITTAQVQRLLVAPSGFPTLETRVGAFEARAVADDDPDALRRGTQERLRRLERRVLADTDDAALVVVDGPLDGTIDLPQAIGYVKTHHVAYLPETVRGVVAALAAGQRTPLFLAQSGWTRFSWYLRLPHAGPGPWAGVVRCESTADVDVTAAVALADRTSALLPRFASRPHKDARAPQNLYPIGGLERHLRHLLGDAAHVLRALRVATA